MKFVLAHPIYLNEKGRREYNEDYVYPKEDISSLSKVFMVCDGVGGSAKGEVASEILSKTYSLEVEKVIDTLDKKDFEPAKIGSLFNQFLRVSENQMSKTVEENPSFHGMASTLTCLALTAHGAIFAWSGDSRIYQFRNGEIINKTKDHSLVNELLELKKITKEEAKNHPKKNVILRAVSGVDRPTEVDILLVDNIKDGDFFFLCTDGILEGITEEQLCRWTNDKELKLFEIKEKINHYCDQNSQDNYSCQLIKVEQIIDSSFVSVPLTITEEHNDVSIPKKKVKTNHLIISLLVITFLSILISIIYLSTNQNDNVNPDNSTKSFQKKNQDNPQEISDPNNSFLSSTDSISTETSDSLNTTTTLDSTQFNK